MVKKVIFTGIEGNDATGDPIREAFEKVNSNFTELYSVFGKEQGFSFPDLADYDTTRNGRLLEDGIFLADPTGNIILTKKLEGDGIEVDLTKQDKIILRNLGAKLVFDETPALGGNLNGQNQFIYNLRDGTEAEATALSVPYSKFAATTGYVGSNFVKLAGSTMVGALKTRNEPINAPVGVEGYDSTYTSNYLTTEAMQRKHSVYRGGDTLTGPLILNADPTTQSDPLTAATKNYVDTNAFASQVNLFVSVSSGNDFRFDINKDKRGSALAYAYKTINAACFRAEQLIKQSDFELGPYQKPVFYNNGANVSTIANIPTSTDSGQTYTLTITNGGTFTDMRGTGSIATIDVRAGLLIRGTISGAIGIIELIDTTGGPNNNGMYSGITIGSNVYGGRERYTIKYKTTTQFQVDEPIEYSSGIQKLNITIFIESGEYYENLPLRVPANVTIVGDDTRRVIIRPKSGISGSQWSNIYFRRDITIDGLDVLTPIAATKIIPGYTYRIASTSTSGGTATNFMSIGSANNNIGTSFQATAVGTGSGTAYCAFGYHYLQDPSRKLYNNIDNDVETISSGNIIYAQKALDANREFLQNEILAVVNDEYPGEYTDIPIRRDTGLIIDALGFDLIYGGYSKTLETAISFLTNSGGLEIGDRLSNTISIINRIRILAIDAASAISISYQVSDPTNNAQVMAFNFDTSLIEIDYVGLIIESLIGLMLDILNQNTAVVNFPKNNNQLDVFLLNDANRIRMVSAQGQGGFVGVLDPEGQILTKSPYVFQCSSFTKSINSKQFAGGLFVDAFTGNLDCKVLENYVNPTSKLTRLKISGLGLAIRMPQLPTAFVVNGIRFEVDYVAPTSQAGQYYAYLNNNTPDDYTYTGLSVQLININMIIELETAGNRSMLCSDFTQVNDLGYGLISSNGSVIEAVSIFTYYCYRGFYSLNGALIRSLNGSCAYGTYALSSEGSDPTEVPTVGYIRYPMVQILTANTTGDYALKNKKGDIIVYVNINVDRSINYVPFSISELEVDHGSSIFGRYEISTVTPISGSNTIFKLNISTTGNDNTITTGLIADIANGTYLTVRILRNFEIVHLPAITTSRPSTALQFDNDSVNMYHVMAFNRTTITASVNSVTNQGVLTVNGGGTIGLVLNQIVTLALLISGNGSQVTASGLSTTTTYYIRSINSASNTIGLSTTLNGGALSITGGSFATGTLSATIGGVGKDLSARVGLDGNYNFIPLTTMDTSGTVGSGYINIYALSVSQAPMIVGMIFAWGGTVHTITNYQTGLELNQTNARISFTPNLTKTTNPASYVGTDGALSTITLRAGLNNKKANGDPIGISLSSQISVMRASGHDLIDIGTGSFTSSNIPTSIYGPPAILKNQSNEVQEIGKGRVFYSTTDQDGNFRVGKYFLVDQGTGTVTFAASIAFSNLTGLGFRSGVTITEFQPDDTLQENSASIVPTQSAVVGYINKRLGVDKTGAVVSGKIGPGFMALDGTSKFGTDNDNSQTLDINSHRIINVLGPSSSSDAVNKAYADTFFSRSGGVRKDIGGFVMSSNTQFTISSIARSGVLIIASVTRSGSTATIVTTLTHDFVTGNIVAITGLNAASGGSGFDNATATITRVNATTFTYASIGTALTLSLSTTTARATLNSRTSTATVTLTETASLSGSHGFSVGSIVVIAGINDVTFPGFNGTVTVTSVPGPTIFTYASSGITVVTTTVGGSTATGPSNIGMNGAKITNLIAPTDLYDAATKKYVDDLVATKDQLSELNDVTITNTASGQVLSYNGTTWVNGLLVNSNVSPTAAISQSKLSLQLSKTLAAKPSGIAVNAGSFIAGKRYTITILGISTDWNIAAGTTASPGPYTYAVGDIFTATTAGTGNGVAIEDIQANSGLSSFSSSNFSIDSGFVTIKDSGIPLSKLATIGNGNLIGNNSGADTNPTTISFANALNSAITLPTAGLIARGSGATFTTIGYTDANTASYIVQRDSNGAIKVGAIKADSKVTASSFTTEGSIESGSIVSTSTISAKTEFQLNEAKLFDFNSKTTYMYNQSGDKVLETSGATSSPAGSFYGTWTLATGAKLQATYADLAEYYESDKDYNFGSVLMIGGDKEVTLAKGEGNTAVVGVVSENPAYLMNAKCPGIKIAVALQGRVPCKVVGTIRKGDLLVTSLIPGVATSSSDPKPGSIIGKALRGYDSGRVGIIEVLVGKH